MVRTGKESEREKKGDSRKRRLVLFLMRSCLSGCCVDVNWERVHLTGDACLNLTYVPKTLSISLTLTVGNLVIINKTVSAENPDICVEIPYLKKLASICLDFTNVTANSKGLSGCADLRAELIGITIEKVKLGCFDIHLLAKEMMVQLERKRKWSNAMIY